eukprot:gene13982-25707_t
MAAPTATPAANPITAAGKGQLAPDAEAEAEVDRQCQASLTFNLKKLGVSIPVAGGLSLLNRSLSTFESPTQTEVTVKFSAIPSDANQQLFFNSDNTMPATAGVSLTCEHCCKAFALLPRERVPVVFPCLHRICRGCAALLQSTEEKSRLKLKEDEVEDTSTLITQGDADGQAAASNLDVDGAGSRSTPFPCPFNCPQLITTPVFALPSDTASLRHSLKGKGGAAPNPAAVAEAIAAAVCGLCEEDPAAKY